MADDRRHRRARELPGLSRPARAFDVGAGAPEPVPAATLVLARPGARGLEVLLTRRPSTMAFGPDIHVFPGGRVEAGDWKPGGVDGLDAADAAEAARRLGLGLAPDRDMTPALALAMHAAAIRETREEAGIEVAPDDLIPLTRWVTPPSLPRRFDVRFFAALVPAGTEVVGDSAEIADATWLAPGDALAAAARGEIALWQPTFVTLQQLDGLADGDAIATAFAPGERAGDPLIQEAGPGVVRVEAAWAGGIPGRRAVGWLLGQGSLVAVDPADPTGETLAAILAHAAARAAELAGVVIGSVAPERHAGVEMLAHGLGLPVVGHAPARAWTPYPVEWLEPEAALPFGDAVLSVEAAVSLG